MSARANLSENGLNKQAAQSSIQDEDLQALKDRKVGQAAKQVQYAKQREEVRAKLLEEEGPQMRQELEDKVCKVLKVFIVLLGRLISSCELDQ